MTLPATAASLTERQSAFVLFLRRMLAMALRHVYLLRGSLPRLIEIAYWPVVNVLIWGFITLYMVKTLSNVTIIYEVLLAGVLMAELLSRSGVNMMMLFLEEIWSHNLGHLFASPLRFSDFVIGLIGLGTLRTSLSLIPAIFVAKYLFGFSLVSLGWPLVAFVALLFMSGWWYGCLLLALLFRFGLAIEWVGWMLGFAIIPIVAPYYPVSILPGWLQVISHALPATYVFESMKSLLGQNELHPENLWMALGLNILYFIVAGFVLRCAYQGARQRGGLLQTGE